MKERNFVKDNYKKKACKKDANLMTVYPADSKLDSQKFSKKYKK